MAQRPAQGVYGRLQAARQAWGLGSATQRDVLREILDALIEEFGERAVAADEPAELPGPPCASALNIAGAHYPCDWPTGPDGRHDGWAHTNKEVQAQWR